VSHEFRFKLLVSSAAEDRRLMDRAITCSVLDRTDAAWTHGEKRVSLLRRSIGDCGVLTTGSRFAHDDRAVLGVSDRSGGELDQQLNRAKTRCPALQNAIGYDTSHRASLLGCENFGGV
jgi:hypothetical protein